MPLLKLFRSKSRCSTLSASEQPEPHPTSSSATASQLHPSDSESGARSEQPEEHKSTYINSDEGDKQINSFSVSIPPYQYPLQRYATTRWILRLANLALEGGINHEKEFNNMSNLMKEEATKWQEHKPTLIDINQLDSHNTHLCELLRKYLFNYSREMAVIQSFNSFLIDQLEHVYNPVLHSGESLLVRLAAWFEKRIDDPVFQWMKALFANPHSWDAKDSSGNNLLAQLIAHGYEESLVALIKGDAFYRIDSIFDVNHSGQNAMDISTQLKPSAPSILKQFEISWHSYCRPYLSSALAEYIIPDLTNLCLSFIDADRKPMVQS